jgi:hypothetical protein
MFVLLLLLHFVPFRVSVVYIACFATLQNVVVINLLRRQSMSVSVYGVDDRGAIRCSSRDSSFSHHRDVQTSSGVHPA